MAFPAVGEPAPAFSLVADDGSTVALAGLRGRPVVLFFYPADNTPVCTKEVCAFRDDFPHFSESNAAIFGVSPDSVASHARFRRRHALPYPLLSDPRHTVASLYGVWGRRKLFGVPYNGVLRTTFVIDGNSTLRNVFSVTSVAGHAAEVQAALNALSIPGGR